MLSNLSLLIRSVSSIERIHSLMLLLVMFRLVWFHFDEWWRLTTHAAHQLNQPFEIFIRLPDWRGVWTFRPCWQVGQEEVRMHRPPQPVRAVTCPWIGLVEPDRQNSAEVVADIAVVRHVALLEG